MSAPEIQRTRVHPRRRPVINDPLPSLATESSPESSKMQLKKGETFHAPTTPSTGNDPVLSVRSLPRRTPTSLDAIAASEERMASILERLTLDDTPEESAPAQDDLPVPRGVLKARIQPGSPASTISRRSSMDSANLPSFWDKRLSHDNGHESDSGLGTSVSSCDVQSTASDSKANNGIHGENPTVGSTIKSTFDLGSSPRRQLPLAACKSIERYILVPLLKEEKLTPFHSLVRSVPSRIVKKQIVCLRDLEKTLLWLAPKYATSRSSYLEFSEYTIQCLHTSTTHLNDRDQRLPTDRPYTNGYFLDLVSQVRRYAAMVRLTQHDIEAAKAYKESSTPIMVTQPSLQGGLTVNGKPAELVVERDGQRISMATGEPYSYDNHPSVKRTLDSFGNELANESVELDEGVKRSMARRKKNAPPMDINQKCSSCDRVFKRYCDLTKHEKTHSRPWKCRAPSNCKYISLGWPTEKERDRHENDKHSATPALYKCKFDPCTYASKRESNCKQHMEKAHGWVYVRSKNNARGGSKRSSPAQATPVTPDLSTPASKPVDFPTPISGSSVFSGDYHPGFNFNDPVVPGMTSDFSLFGESPNSHSVEEGEANNTSMPFDYGLSSANLDGFQAQFQNGHPDDLISDLGPIANTVMNMEERACADLGFQTGLDWEGLQDNMMQQDTLPMYPCGSTGVNDLYTGAQGFSGNSKADNVYLGFQGYNNNLQMTNFANDQVFDQNLNPNVFYPGARDVPLYSAQ
ncbi:Zinc finger C2H2 [Penicillium capsulatum]|uniref:Zinc finger C2H2 n=1 Tax=Penicillium capsulatum TaxID=69766 RepID=A0A9W9I386_9EURO|nr:Zinc finger C2H2 [Penicillium capsulatum]